MTVYDLTFLFTEDSQEIAIYGLDSEKTLYQGTIYDMDYKYNALEVCSIDCIENNVLTINVEM